ncbi:DUF992 domain-containing protein [Bosea sp. NBC_00550]|uniref:DUF992 domain-containing protein n=1 Tax=Bosea sp. NBC_00550 TaxID=2969621 RepID=UPI00223119BB|nr:DUF992 domain-containing protein [Bosea sp. NBC_00550]UZF91440.1 DUF992 domain-containing protein [Bosea sp. NBC_00550]
MSTPALAQSSEPPTGRLSCTVSGGLAPVVTAQKPMECRFRPRRGPLQHYTGIVRSFGLDLASVRSAALAWRVYGPYARAPLGALAGQYKATGATPGAGGNTLVGGDNNAVTLQPLPFQGNRGINVAVGVTSFELTLVAPGRRR